ncbi:MAG: Gfo/Idh/MocA family oxidoreductase, partial [bacterium]
MKEKNNLQVTIVGGGMITHDQILPSIYQLQRLGIISEINISALNAAPLKFLAESEEIKKAFPESGFKSFPDFNEEPLDRNFPDLFKEVIEKMPPYQAVVVAVPDQLHYGVLKIALENNQNVLCVKPLVLKYSQAMEIERLAYDRGLVIGVEYHKRFDYRSLIARRRYRNGEFGEFKVGQARLIEPWYYRHSNFQNWCTIENSDMFSYIACHYVDLVHFITGLLPVEVSVKGIVEKYPNGREGFLYTDGRVIWNNRACLNVQNALGYPDQAPGGNSQGMMLFCQGEGDIGGHIDHHDSFRGVKHSTTPKVRNEKTKYYHETNPDFVQYIENGGEGLAPAGYGYRSIEGIITAITRSNKAAMGLTGEEALKKRREMIKTIDKEGLIATPANSAFNELVMEAGRLSVMNDGRDVIIEYGENAGVRFKEYPDY